MSPADRTRIAALAISIALSVGAARAHEAPSGWLYPPSCCSSQDCRQDDAAAVPVKGGWRIAQTGEIIAETDVRRRDSPDGLLHICMSAADFESQNARTLCLFTPVMGF